TATTAMTPAEIERRAIHQSDMASLPLQCDLETLSQPGVTGATGPPIRVCDKSQRRTPVGHGRPGESILRQRDRRAAATATMPFARAKMESSAINTATILQACQ